MKIELIPWTSELKTDLIRVCNQADRRFLSNHLPYPYQEKDAEEWFKKVEKEEGEKGLFRGISCNGEIVGTISIIKNSSVSQSDAELGYFLLSKDWSRGIMSQAVEEICALAFEKLGLRRISAQVFAPNLASQRVLEKNGFVLEGKLREAADKDGEVSDVLCYGKLRKEIK